MTDFATRCPHCQTSFQVSENQLAVASGLVRCGSCLNIFNAADNWIDIDLDDYNEAQQVLPLDEDPANEDVGDIEDTLFDIEPVVDEDESLDEFSLLKDIARTNAGLLSRRDDQLAPGSSGAPEPDADWGEREPGHDDEEISIIDDDFAPPREPATADNANIPCDDTDFEEIFTEDDERYNLEALTLDDDDRDAHRERQPRRASRLLLWFLLSLLAAAALVAQYVYYEFDKLASSEYRPWLQRLCEYLPCELPAASYPALIDSRDLLVRSHPEVAEALRIDTVLRNRAPFPQAYPVLELRFSGLRGELLAARRFQPAEYLGGELSPDSLMPAQQPVHVSLDIVDPGNDAVNFQVTLHAAGTR